MFDLSFSLFSVTSQTAPAPGSAMSNLQTPDGLDTGQKNNSQITQANNSCQVQHLKGLPLFVVISCITTVCFLMFLDSAILPTVSNALLIHEM